MFFPNLIQQNFPEFLDCMYFSDLRIFYSLRSTENSTLKSGPPCTWYWYWYWYGVLVQVSAVLVTQGTGTGISVSTLKQRPPLVPNPTPC